MILGIISSIFNPLLHYNNIIIYSSLLSIILIYNKEKEYYLKCTLIGLIFDIISSTYIINAILYLILSLIVSLFFNTKKYNLKNILLMSIFIIFSYNTVYYFILNIFRINTFSYLLFVTNLFYIYVINLIYVMIIFIIKDNKHS